MHLAALARLAASCLSEMGTHMVLLILEIAWGKGAFGIGAGQVMGREGFI